MSLLLLWSPLAGAAGYFVTDVGARGMAQGGAFVAGADDLTALYYNPAALGNLRGPQVMFDFAAVHQSVHFDRQDEAELVFDEVSNEAPPMLIPTVGIAHDFNTEKLVVGLGFYSPYAPDLKYDLDGAQRYTLTDSTLLSGNVGPSVAFRAHEWVTLGAGIAWSFLYVSQDLVATASIDGGTDEKLFDIRSSFSVGDFLAVTGNFGAVVGPPGGLWNAALAVQLPTRYSATGDLSLDFTENAYYTGELGIGQVIASDVVTDEVTLDLTLPLIVRGGVVTQVTDRLTVELAGVYERWRVIQELRVTDVNLVIDTVDGEPVVMTEDVVIPAAYQDAFSIRLGGNYAVHDRLKARAGVFFESSAVPEKALGVGLVDGKKLGYGIGVSWQPIPNLSLDAAWGQSFLFPIETRSSTVAQVAVDPLTNDIGSGKFVAHGTYRSRFQVAVVGATYSFGR